MRLPPAERRDKLMASARRTFGEQGFTKAEVTEIARRAGVTKPILYRHFPGGKSEIYLAVLEERVEDLSMKLWEVIASSKRPRDRLFLGLDAYLQFAEKDPSGFAMFTDAGAKSDAKIGERLARARDTIIGALSNTLGDVMKGLGIDATGAPVYAHALMGAVESVTEWWLHERKPPREQLADYILAFVWRGFDGLPKDPTKFHTLLEAIRPASLPSRG